MCDLCQRAKELGWWGDSRITHCRECHRTWSRTSREAHCSVCHRHFGGVSGFDDHLIGHPRGKAEHHDPRSKQRQYRQDEAGVWRSDYQGPVLSPPQAVSLESTG